MEEPKININENPQKEKAELTPQELKAFEDYVALRKSQAKPSDVDQTAEQAKLVRREAKGEPLSDEQQKTPETDFINEEIKEIDKWEEAMGKKQEFREPVAEVSESEEEHPYGKRPYSKEEEEEIYGREKVEKTEKGEAGAEKKPEGGEKKEKTEKNLLIEKLNTDRNACAEALYQKDKMGSELDKKVGFFKRIFMGETKRETLRGGNEDYKKREENYKQAQEDYKATLKDYRIFLIGEKKQQLDNNYKNFIKHFPNGEKMIADDILKNVKPKDFLWIASYRGKEQKQIPEENYQKYTEAVARKGNFIEYLKQQGVKDEEAEKIYRQIAVGELYITGNILRKAPIDEVLERYAKEVAIETSVKEATKINLAKHEKEIEERARLGEGQKMEWIRTKGLEVAQWYRKQSTRNKYLISGALFGGAMAGGAIGGTAGAVVIAGMSGGRLLQRGLSGLGTAVGVEALIKRSQEKSAEKKITRELCDNFSKALLEKNDVLDNKLFEILGGKKSEEKRRYILAGVAGGLVGSGALAYAFKEALPDSIRDPILQKMGGAKEWLFEKLGVGKPPITGAQEMPHGKPGGGIGGPLQEKILPIGTRGPEGVIIDHLRTHPDLAKSWGWDGKTPINQFAGSRAHLMWQNFADTEIAKPEVQSKLAELGYTQDTEGYSEMMRRIGKGFVELDPKGSMRLTDTAFLKAAEVTAGQQFLGVTPESLSPEPGDGEVSMGEVLPDKEQVPTGKGLDEGLREMDEKFPPKRVIPEPEARAMAAGKLYVVNDMPPSPEEIAKNFVPGEEYENLLRKSAGIDKLLTPDDDLVKSASEAISERVDKAIAATINMNETAYSGIKTMNLRQFIEIKPPTLAAHLEWKPAQRAIDEYLKNNKFDPEDLKKNVGEFFKKIIKIDIRK